MTYTHPDHIQFVNDMWCRCDTIRHELEVRHYNGRFWWQGPAVAVDNLQDALSHTKVRCQWDNLGLGYIVYPVTSMSKGANNDAAHG